VRDKGTVFVSKVRCPGFEARLMPQQFTDNYADTEIDIDGVKGCINDLRSVKTRYPHVKTILSFGGGGEGSAPFPAVASNGIVRSIFAQSARQMVDAYGFDGMDSKESPVECELMPFIDVQS